MQGGKSGRNQRHQRKQRLSYSMPKVLMQSIVFLNDQIATLAFRSFLMRGLG